ncbi:MULTISPECIES: hypothetical protein [unclassified Beijerinckia]|uniref:hypothetical protein n=1 Tax=unclassified Beijerinckia TaxID=2638183 RepID=UPI0008977174|nr:MULTISPECIES: hypothetical protein [unclassified Beijerinckia]MDH7799136.1 4,5-dihydroxyphthalate decarboxylase [Beijerinckia sp. GAS462]SED93949.1 4,5-dihydroxyphthalate decarboxylase [Beijerinckia sp. 28-YEA-48]
MSDLPLSVACWNYDRTRSLIDGRIKPAGIDLRVDVMRPRLAFERMLAGDFDMSEMSFATLVSMKSGPNCPFVAIPVILSKMFRHDIIYIRRGSGIREPGDLRGRRVGTMRFTSTALVYARGLLKHEYGVAANEIDWFIGGIDHGIAPVMPSPIEPGLKVTLLGATQCLNAMLLSGEIDALISQDMPESFRNRDPNVDRLFPNVKEAEIAYYRKTGIFPVMHTIAIRNDVYERTPWVAAAVYAAFEKAKDFALNGLYDTDALQLGLPFLIDHIEEAKRVFGKDFFSYGIEKNRAALSALCQYVHEQNMASVRLLPEDLFVPVSP